MSEANAPVCGPEVYSEMQRLICEWYGMDSADRTAAIPQLVRDLVQTQQNCNHGTAARAAGHDCTEAA